MTNTRYRAAYAALLINHMSRGHSLESFAALETDEKEVVDFATVRQWLHRHISFARGFAKGRGAGLLFFERQLLAGMGSTGNRADTRAAMFMLSKLYGDVYSDKARQSLNEERTKSALGVDIRDIDDPEELLCLARSLGARSGKRPAVKHACLVRP